MGWLQYLVRNNPGGGSREDSVNKESSDQPMQKLLNMLNRYFCNAHHDHHIDHHFDNLDHDNSVDDDSDDKEVNDDMMWWQH